LSRFFQETISSQSDESLSGSDSNVPLKSSSVTFHLKHDGRVVSSPRIHPSTSSSITTPVEHKDHICEMCQSNIHMTNKQSNDNWSSGNSNDDFTAKTHPRPSAKHSLFGDNINELLDPLKDRERLDPLSNLYEVQKSAKTKTNC
jgi:hypothetical protein